jgi:putative transposase
MKAAGLLPPKQSGRSVRVHDGKVSTLKSNLRFCSDNFELHCGNGEKVRVAFALDCCDREVVSFVAGATPLVGEDIRDVMAEVVDVRFSSTKCPPPVEWLSDNGPTYTAHETRSFTASCGFIVRSTPSYSPKSNGMAEALVKTLKRNDAYVADFDNVTAAATVLRPIPGRFED